MADITQSVTANVTGITVQVDMSTGDCVVICKVIDAVDGSDRGRMIISAPQVGAVYDQKKNQLAASTPTGVKSAATSLVSAIQTTLANASAAGKFVLP